MAGRFLLQRDERTKDVCEGGGFLRIPLIYPRDLIPVRGFDATQIKRINE